ncbi:MAG: Gfo/Idh/MocA family oxidoreductase [Actinomycetota bacterium]|nr:Gfo/Idh/MocA family oxidoreductase [Actinomycetota bacterium]
MGAVETDAALIVVPPAIHAPLALEALESGLHCLIEKPFASTLADAHLVVERAASSGRVVMVSQQYRHRAGARTVAQLIETGALGRIGAAYVNISSELATRGFQHEMEEPLLWDMAIHHFDLMRGILGLEPARIQATSSNPTWSLHSRETRQRPRYSRRRTASSSRHGHLGTSRRGHGVGRRLGHPVRRRIDPVAWERRHHETA